ncbi:MAG: hypothetical protein ABFD50_19380 [Smithella sp.]
MTYVAQAIPQIDAAGAEKSLFRTQTIYSCLTVITRGKPGMIERRFN